MKTRLGFVSNSSSSSFVCMVCGEEACGMDISLSDYNMFKCNQSHVICDSHGLENDLGQKYHDSTEYENDEFSNYEVPEKYCPVCQLKYIPDEYMVDYLLARDNLLKKDITVEIQSKFRTYSEFKKYNSEFKRPEK